MAENQNTSKNRKSEAEEIFEQADNAGRFAGTDPDSKAAKEQAIENIRQDTQSTANKRNKDDDIGGLDKINIGEGDDQEAQNVRDDMDRLIEEDETDHARNKATEGQKQNRDV